MIKYSDKTKNFARANRKQQTPQEGKLWNLFLKNLSTNFTRQYRIGNYILDFYAPSIRLAIEIDGGGHYTDEQMIKDKERTEYLRKYNIQVLRFTNIDIDKNIKGVEEVIDNAVQSINITN